MLVNRDLSGAERWSLIKLDPKWIEKFTSVIEYSIKESWSLTNWSFNYFFFWLTAEEIEIQVVNLFIIFGLGKQFISISLLFSFQKHIYLRSNIGLFCVRVVWTKQTAKSSIRSIKLEALLIIYRSRSKKNMGWTFINRF